MRTGLMALSGYNDRAVVALCRWAAAAGVPLHLVARDEADRIHLTAHAASVFVQRESPQLDVAGVAAWLHALRGRHGYDRVVIAPSTEFFNRFLLRHRAAIEAAGGVVPLVDEALYAQVSDKEAFATMCAAHGIAVPAVFDGLPEGLPFVAKPRHYGAATSGQVKPYLVFTPEDRAAFLQREDPSRFFFQEFVEGESLYLLAHVARDGKVAACAQQNLIQQPFGGSIVLARAHGFHHEPAARAYLDMLRGAGFHGLVMIEVRRCARSGRTVMIEANPRLWGPLQFVLDQGVDLLTPYFADHGLDVQSPAPSATRHDFYFWSGGLAHPAAPCTFHGYSADDFVADHAPIARADLLARDDTRRLHAHELQPA